MTKQTKIKHYTKRDYAAFAYLAPWIIGMLILQLYPFLSSLVYSFCNYKSPAPLVHRPEQLHPVVHHGY